MGRASKITADARKAAVAANLVSSSPQAPEQLAPQLGVTAGHAGNLARDPATRAIAASLLEPHRARIAEMLPKAMARIEEALDAGEPAVIDKDTGVVVRAEVPDVLMRLRAVDRLRKLVELLDFYDKKDPTGGHPQDGLLRGTLEELLVSYRRVTSQSGSR